MLQKFKYLPSFLKKHFNPFKKKGLLSATLLIKDKDALSLARPREEKSFIKKIEEASNKEDGELNNGISSFFTLPDFTKITKNHNIQKLDLVPISINLSQLLKDEPTTTLRGVELKPYFDDMTDAQFKSRQKDLSLKEVISYTLMDPKDLWKDYDISHTSHYASDVPHLIILPPNKKIYPKYLKL